MGFQRTKMSKGGGTFQYRNEALLQLQRRSEAILRATFTTLHAILLASDPIAKIAVRERLHETTALAIAIGHLVVVNKSLKTIRSCGRPKRATQNGRCWNNLQCPSKNRFLNQSSRVLLSVSGQQLLQCHVLPIGAPRSL